MTTTWGKRWDAIADANQGTGRMRVLTAEDNAYTTMVERHGRTPGNMSDPMWEEWSEVAVRSYDFLSDVDA